MMRALFVMVAIFALTISATQPDEVLLETLVEEPAAEMSFMEAEARATIKATADDSACTDAANSMLQEVTGTQNQMKQELAVSADDTHCDTLNDEAVNDAEKTAADASTAADVTSDALSTEESTPVEVTRTVDAYTCESFMQDEAYLQQVAKISQATTDNNNAQALKTSTENAAQAARDARTRAQAECRCVVERAVEATWKTVAADQATRTADFAQSTKIKCLLAGTPMSDASCQATLEQLVKPDDKIDEDKCFEWVNKESTETCNTDCDAPAHSYNGPQECHDVRGDDAGQGCVEAGVAAPPPFVKTCQKAQPCVHWGSTQAASSCPSSCGLSSSVNYGTSFCVQTQAGSQTTDESCVSQGKGSKPAQPTHNCGATAACCEPSCCITVTGSSGQHITQKCVTGAYQQYVGLSSWENDNAYGMQMGSKCQSYTVYDDDEEEELVQTSAHKSAQNPTYYHSVALSYDLQSDVKGLAIQPSPNCNRI